MMIFQRNQGINSILEICDIYIPDNYEEKMLTHCHFDSIIPTEIREIDGEKSLCVKVDGLSPIMQRYRRICPGKEEVKSLLNGINRCFREIREFLMNPNGVIVTADYIYYSERTGEYKFIYVPGNEFDFRGQIKGLFEEIMRIYDHKDADGVKYLYDLYSQMIKDNFTIEMFAKLEDKKQPKTIITEKDTVSNGLKSEIKNDAYSDVYVTHINETEIKLDKSRYYMLLGLALIIAVAMLIIFGPSSLKFSAIGLFAVVVYMVVDMSHKKNEAELEKSFKDAAGNTDLILKDIDEPKSHHQELISPAPDIISENCSTIGQGTTILSRNNNKNVSKLLPSVIGQEQIYLIEGSTKIGRLESECDVVINDESVSRIHAVVERRGEVVTVTDMGSTNGTYVNDNRLDEGKAVMLNPGDTVGIAAAVYECV